MSQNDKEKRMQQQKERMTLIMFIPLMVLLAIIPLIVRLTYVVPADYVFEVLKKSQFFDFFSQAKSTGIIIITIIMILVLFFLFQKQDIKKDKYILVYICAISLFWVLTMLSTVMSSYREVATWGMPDRAEGLVVISCYVMIFLYTLYAVKQHKDYRYIMLSISTLVLVSTILGVLQYFGHDFFNSDLGKNIIVPKGYEEAKDMLSIEYEKGKMYGTMFHYNYMGSFAAMVTPLFAALTLFIKGRKSKVFLGALTVLSCILLFGSTSRAGLIGLVAAILVAIVVFAKEIVRRWKLTIPVAVGFIALVIGLNVVTGGTIFERIPTLVNDAFSMFAGVENDFDYRDYIPLREVTIKEGKAHLVTQTDTLVISIEKEGLGFTDQNGQAVVYDLAEQQYTTQDSRFSNIQFKFLSLGNEKEDGIGVGLLVNNLQTFLFGIDNKNELVLIDNFTNQPIEIDNPEAWGFKGKEKLGSARGYIWSRSLPLLKDTLLIGHGPDTFALEFPQEDYLGKWWAYDTPNMIVDKPHNLYLQIALNNGVVALIAFLVVVGLYIIDSLRLYAFRRYYTDKQALGAATMLGIVGYLGAGIFNDSIISVAPVFWVLLGAGIAVNYLNNQEYIKIKMQERETRSKVISLNNN